METCYYKIQSENLYNQSVLRLDWFVHIDDSALSKADQHPIKEKNKIILSGKHYPTARILSADLDSEIEKIFLLTAERNSRRKLFGNILA